jgi:hypothetical protein
MSRARLMATLALATALPAAAQTSSFERMVADTGCASKYSDDKKADIFNANYKGRAITATGQIATLSSGDLSLKVLPGTMTYDILVTLRDPRAGYDLEKGQRVTVKFVVSYHGGCVLRHSDESYIGEQGEIIGR